MYGPLSRRTSFRLSTVSADLPEDRSFPSLPVTLLLSDCRSLKSLRLCCKQPHSCTATSLLRTFRPPLTLASCWEGLRGQSGGQAGSSVMGLLGPPTGSAVPSGRRGLPPGHLQARPSPCTLTASRAWRCLFYWFQIIPRTGCLMGPSPWNHSALSDSLVGQCWGRVAPS